MTQRLTLAIAELVEALREELRTEAGGDQRSPDRLLSIDEAADALGIGRTRAYREIQDGRLRTVTVGRRRLVPASAIDEFIGASP